METFSRIFLSLIIAGFSSLLFANCNLHQFRYPCDITLKPYPTRYAKSLVYCGNSRGYVTKHDYDILTKFHRRSINMTLSINGEFLESPCIPADR